MKDTFGDRMKRYEAVTDIKLTNLTPVIIRVDGKAFHTLTHRLDKPYDTAFADAMKSTMWHLVRTIQNCVFGYVTSDEISLLLIEPTEYSDSYFDNRLNKLVSIAAAEASTFFRDVMSNTYNAKRDQKYAPLACRAIFDARAFNIPKHEVVNYFIWRQQDCLRNAVAGAGQANFSQKELNGLHSDKIIEKLKSDKNIDFYKDYPSEFIWGRIACRVPIEMQSEFFTDATITAPDFKEDRNIIASVLPEYL